MEKPQLTTDQVTAELRQLLEDPNTLLGMGADKGDGWRECVLHRITVADTLLSTVTFEVRQGDAGLEIREVAYLVEG